MRIIDAHNHLFQEFQYEEKLLEVMDELEIEKCCISGLGPLFYLSSDRYLLYTIGSESIRNRR